jgi:hypothetical protein
MSADLSNLGPPMPEQASISFFVKLEHWGVYRLKAVLTATVFVSSESGASLLCRVALSVH